MDILSWQGLLGGLSPWTYVGIGLVSVQLTIMAVTLYLHRSQAHGGVVFHPAVNHVFRFWLWFTTGMVTREWVAIHRKHHAFSDRPGDPHSPVTKGIWRIFPFGVIEYVREAHNRETIERYGRGTPDDWLERRVYSAHPVLGVASGFLAAILLFGPAVGVMIALAHVLWIPFWAAGVINGLGHSLGYRNYATTDNSRNTVPFFAFAVWIGGEELHNNHHAYATSAKFSHRWFEFDIGWGVIVLLSWCGLATVKHRAPRAVYDEAKSVPDAETLAAVRALRFDVLSRFDRLVQHSRADVDWQGIRARLIALWEERRSEHELLANLRLWHAEAMRSGSEALQAFAKHLARLRTAKA
ncbi:MAG: acyl-CoA desaturase [Candidatus Moraniibacteriota bacterium]|nr:MAG: acyl-CoA desaturase [Candidatus Moranbacteria bacterium]